jgi:protein TonB
MDYRIGFVAACLAAALHAGVWFALTRTPKQPTPAHYLQFSVVEAQLTTASTKTVGTPKQPKRAHPREHPKPKPRPRPQKKVAVAVKPKPVQSSRPVKTVAKPAQPYQPFKTSPNTPSPPVAPQPYTAPNYGAAYLHNPPPVYPLMARRRGISGRVLLRAEITSDGHCRDVRVIQSSGYKILDESALTAVKKWRFVPATRGSQAVTATVDIPLNFKLQGES